MTCCVTRGKRDEAREAGANQYRLRFMGLAQDVEKIYADSEVNVVRRSGVHAKRHRNPTLGEALNWEVALTLAPAPQYQVR